LRRDPVKTALLLLLAIAIGWIVWSGNVLLLPAALAFPLLWANSPSRLASGLVASGYFLTASRGLPQGVGTYYAADLWPGLLLWLLASVSFVLVHAVLWTQHHGWRRATGYLAVLIFMALPPFGITGWAHPITAAGVLFPGWGWVGLAVTTAGLVGMTSRLWPAMAVIFSSSWIWSAATWNDANPPERWRAVDLQMGATLGRDNSLRRQQKLIETARKVATDPRGSTVVLPESALGFWTPTTARFWQSSLAATNMTVVGGAVIIDAGGYDNVLVEASAKGSRILYRERMPVPGAMWQPWLAWFGQAGGARAHFFDNPLVDVGSTKVAPLICYEQLIVWPILQSMIHDPDIVVAVGNGWWTEGTAIVDIQRASAQAWARLFDKPLVFSFNT
jgi:hypothetical protein